MNGRRVVVLCPMRIEHAAVLRAVRAAGLDGVEVVQTGVGREAVVRGVIGAVGSQGCGRGSRVDARPPPSPLPLGGGTGTRVDLALVVLAGACGGLRECGDVPRIGRVIDDRGGEWQVGGVGDGEGVTLIGVDRVVSTPQDKRALAERTGAAIVDMESHAFAAECERLGVRWHIVRGVSDTPGESLPDAVLGWIDGAGNTRYGRAVCDIVRRPRLIGPIAIVMRRSHRVLPQVGAAVVEFIRRG